MFTFVKICAGVIMIILTALVIGIAYDFARGEDNADE